MTGVMAAINAAIRRWRVLMGFSADAVASTRAGTRGNVRFFYGPNAARKADRDGRADRQEGRP
jgi:hypothetical protein